MNWKKFYSREYGVQYTEIALKCISNKVNGMISQPVHRQFFTPENSNEAYYAELADWKQFEDTIIENHCKDTKSLEKFSKIFFKKGNEYLAVSKKLAKLKKINSNTVKDYLEYQKIAIEYATVLWIAHIGSEFFSKKTANILNEYMRKIPEKKVMQYSTELLRPAQKAKIIILQEELKKLKEKPSKQKLEELFEEYSWMSCLDIHNAPWSITEFSAFAENLKSSKITQPVSFDQIVKELKISKNDLKAIHLAKKLGYLKDARDDFRRQSIFFARKFFKLIADEMNLSLHEFSYLTQQEIVDFLKKKKVPNQYEIEQRMQGFLIFLKNKKTQVISGNKIVPTLKKIFKFQGISTSPIIQVKGLSACQGIVEGTAKIVKGVNDLHKVHEGDILIAVTTHPDYVSVMHKAKAIVTDEGGILCHAAIVSREMNKPCIVGTGQGTKVFKDGDLVQVDASQGIVKKVN
ncbi:MAG: PEP-utilizing enzyme [Candidatus Diapherotrites archaeon]|nr:PEP-utilizing enzyme [Candidatus Diapherotrites archaeon]